MTEFSIQSNKSLRNELSKLIFNFYCTQEMRFPLVDAEICLNYNVTEYGRDKYDTIN